jgi:hypothetical protein
MLTDGKYYFDGEASKQRDRIAALEGDILSFQAEYIGIDPTNPGALKLKITSLETDQSELGREIATLEREVDSRRRLIAMHIERAAAAKRRAEQSLRNAKDASVELPGVIKSVDTQAIEDEIQVLERSIHDLKLERRMTDLHPDIIERRNQIGRLRERLKEQYLADARSMAANGQTAAGGEKPLPANHGVSLDDIAIEDQPDLTDDPSMEMAAMRMGLHDLQGRLDAARSRLRFVEEDMAKHQSLEENVYKYRKEYKLKQDVLAQTRADYNENTKRSKEIANILKADESERGITFVELTPPTPCVRPVKPRGSTILMLGLLAGLAAGAVSVLLKELFDQTYHTTKQVTRSLGVAILESVDEIVTSVDRARRFRRRVFYTPVVVTLALGTVMASCAAAYLSLEQPRTFERAIHVPSSLWQRIAGEDVLASDLADELDDEENSAFAVPVMVPAVTRPDIAPIAAPEAVPDDADEFADGIASMTGTVEDE